MECIYKGKLYRDKAPIYTMGPPRANWIRDLYFEMGLRYDDQDFG